MKRKIAAAIIAMLFMLLPASPAHAIRDNWSESECIEALRQCESLVLVEFLSCEVDYENLNWMEDEGYLCNVELRFIKTIYGEEKPTGVYTLRGYFDERADYETMILEIREPTKKEKITREMKPYPGAIFTYDAGDYVIGLSSLTPVTAKDGSVSYYDSWLKSRFPSEQNLVDKLNGKVNTDDWATCYLPNEYDAIFDGRLWEEGGFAGELIFARITKGAYLYAQPDKASKKRLPLRVNDRVVIYREAVEDGDGGVWAKVLYGEGNSGYIAKDALEGTSTLSKPYSVTKMKLARVVQSGRMHDANYIELPRATVRKDTVVVIGEQVTHGGSKYYRILGGPQALAYIPAECVSVLKDIALETSRPLVSRIQDCVEEE